MLKSERKDMEKIINNVRKAVEPLDYLRLMCHRTIVTDCTITTGMWGLRAPGCLASP